MNRIEKKFKDLKRQKKKTFIAYIAAGDPNLSVTKRLILELENNGTDIIELGIPFSDPLADGPTIQAASERALKNKNVTLGNIISMVRQIRPKTDTPLVFMTYYNPVLHYGVKRFVTDAKKAGVDGVIVPDLPPEEAGALIAAARKNRFSTIFLLAPTSTRQRIELISKKSTGFIYYVSLTGVTGARNKLPKEIKSNIRRIRRISRMPVCVGFGVSSPKQARAVAKIADGVIVGSAIVKVIEKNLGKNNLVEKTGRFVKGLANAAHQR